jgi:hypothetical protein
MKEPIIVFYESAQDKLSKTRRVDLVQWHETIIACEKDGMSRRDAIVHASDAFSYLHPLLSDLYEAEDDAERKRAEKEENASISGIKVGRKRQPYIQNVRWAVKAAGNTRLNGIKPKQCPNYIAWYLYEQALDEPTKFTTILNAVETKQKENKDEFKEQIKRDSEKSISQINKLLAEITRTS